MESYVEWHVELGSSNESFETREEAMVWIDLLGGNKYEWRLERHVVELIDANYTNYN